MEIMDLADKMNKMEEKTDIQIKLSKLTELTSGMFLILEQSDGAMCAYISGQLSTLSDYAKSLSDIKMKDELPIIPEVELDEPHNKDK